MRQGLLASAAAILATAVGGIWRWGERALDLTGAALQAYTDLSHLVPPEGCPVQSACPAQQSCDCSVTGREWTSVCLTCVALVGGGACLGRRLTRHLRTDCSDDAASDCSDGSFSAFATKVPGTLAPRLGGKLASTSSGGSLAAFAVDARYLD